MGIRKEFSYTRFSWLGFVWDHIVTTDLRPVFYALERVLRVPCSIIHEKLLHSSCLILVLDRLAREQTNCAQLVTDDESFTIT